MVVLLVPPVVPVTSRPVDPGAGGRGEALGYAGPPKGGQSVIEMNIRVCII